MRILLLVWPLALFGCAPTRVRVENVCDGHYQRGLYVETRMCLQSELTNDVSGLAERRIAGLDREVRRQIDLKSTTIEERSYLRGYEAWRRSAHQVARNEWRKFVALAVRVSPIRSRARIREVQFAFVKSGRIRDASPPPTRPKEDTKQTPTKVRARPPRFKSIQRDLSVDKVVAKGDSALRNGRPQQALRYYEWALRIDPEDRNIQRVVRELRETLE